MPNTSVNEFADYRVVVSAVIASGASLSAEVDLNGLVCVGIEMPGTWTAAGLTFKGGNTSGALLNVYSDGGTEYSKTVDASRAVYLETVNPLLPWRYIQVRSGTSGTAVNQAAERTIKLICRPV
jgi:hypothetical protein